MLTDTLISVIIPMYNVEKYLEECILSIEKQKNVNLEIIAVDDGSTDKTLMIAKRMKKQFSNFRLYSKTNGGQASARNYGYERAGGEYVSFIDADDVTADNMLSTLLSKMANYELDIAVCGYQDFTSKGYGREYRTKADENHIYNGRDFYNLKPSLSPCDKLYKKSYLDSINFKCTEGHYAEDVFDTTYALIQANRIMYIDKCMYFYRRDNIDSTRNNLDLYRRTKLGLDKLYIAQKLDSFKKEKSLDGYIESIIIRNIVGTFFSNYYLKKEYRDSINEAAKKNQINKIVMNNLSFTSFVEIFCVGIRKLVSGGD